MADSSILHLVIEKGPKQGETLTHKSGTLIRIGRVVKGNTFTIKDPSISQKHLSIEFMSGIWKWAVKDLDTSNGTLVNDIKIPPLTPFPLSSGDTIKIGETTLISIAVEGADSEIDVEAKRGRKRGRCIGDLVDGEEKCGEEMKNLGIGRSRRVDSSRVTKKDEILGCAVNDDVKIRTRRGNSSRACRKENILDTAVVESVKLMSGRGNSSRVSNEDETLDVVDESIKVRPRSGNSSRVLKNDENLTNVVEERVEIRPRRAGLRTRTNGLTTEKEKLMENEKKFDGVMEEVPKIVKRRRPNKAPAPTQASPAPAPASASTQASPAPTQASPAKILQSEDMGEVNGKNKETNIEEENEVDFEKMTLGEWFDSMEKYLPKAINEAAEQVIESLKEKARLFDEYATNLSNTG